jgi:hypothetical protein
MWISEAGTIHRWFSGAYLMRTSGHILISLLLISGWLNRSLVSWLLFCAVRFLWFFAYVLMTSVTYGVRKSSCKVMFDMYRRALANFIFWQFILGSFVTAVQVRWQTSVSFRVSQRRTRIPFMTRQHQWNHIPSWSIKLTLTGSRVNLCAA